MLELGIDQIAQTAGKKYGSPGVLRGVVTRIGLDLHAEPRQLIAQIANQ